VVPSHQARKRRRAFCSLRFTRRHLCCKVKILQRVIQLTTNLLRSIPVFDFSYSLHILLLHLGAQVVCERSRHHKLLRLILGRKLNFVSMSWCLTLLLESCKRTVGRVFSAVLGHLASPARTLMDVASIYTLFIPVQSGIIIISLSLCCWRQIVRTTEDVFLWVL